MNNFLKIAVAAVFVAFSAPLVSGQEYKTDEIKDLALIYQGGAKRISWTEDDITPYVVHTFLDGSKEWLFDGFLFLDFSDGRGHNLAYGYEKENATKTDWQWFLNRVFQRNHSLDALNKCITRQKQVIGNPPFRHKLVLGLPSPIAKQQDWGKIGGKALDFSKRTDQVKAVKWYIGKLMKKFKEAKLSNLDLVGFYWVDEDTIGCKGLPRDLSPYIHSLGLKFYWIPYWQARGFDKWKDMGFDIAYQQPNYFFDHKVPYQRLIDACNTGLKHNMGMEMEFDSKVLFARENSSWSRMKDYLDVFEQMGVFRNSAIAYYSGSYGIIDMMKSPSVQDREILDRMARYILERRSKK